MSCRASGFDEQFPQNMCTREAGHDGAHRCSAADKDSPRALKRFITSGPAFPTPEFFDERMVGVTTGMTLRDFFAQQSAPCYLAFALAEDDDASPAAIADKAYLLADAMMARRLA